MEALWITGEQRTLDGPAAREQTQLVAGVMSCSSSGYRLRTHLMI